jgi:alpha-L-fucosidase
MQPWFTDAKLGIFIHWGIYSAGNWSESWAFFNGQVGYEEYCAQAEVFTASHYEPQEWARLFAEAGAKYAVLTTKHHDGFALWPTTHSKWNAVESSPAGRDLIGPYCQALRDHGLKVGLYFSHLDWSHPDYASVLPTGAQPHDHAERHSNKFAYPQGPEDPAAWERFLEFHRAQLKELCDLYEPDLLWFDGDWERDPQQWRFAELREELKSALPHVILNSRMGGYGDYGTPEQAIPISPPSGPWEFCVTMNDNWGYVAADQNHKTPRHCVRMLAECAGMGGNLLLDIGPKSDGTIIPEQTETLRALGRWTSKNGEALYGTKAGLPHGHWYGPSTLSADGKTLYLVAFDTPVEQVMVKGIKNKVARVSVIGGSDLPFKMVGGAPWAGLPGVLTIDVPSQGWDSLGSVFKVELESPLELYTGHGDPVTFNQ